METMKIEVISNEFDPEVLGEKFNAESYEDFYAYLRQLKKSNSDLSINIVADWVSREKTRSAKALFDSHASKFNIGLIIIRATREQYEEDSNAFESGVKWEEKL